MDLIRDGEAADEGVYRFKRTGLDTGGGVIMLALRDRVLHREHEMWGIRALITKQRDVRNETRNREWEGNRTEQSEAPFRSPQQRKCP
jgi:hypothetical protein